MTVVCNILNCGYNTEGICCQHEYVVLVNGQCKWLINNPNYQHRETVTTTETTKQ